MATTTEQAPTRPRYQQKLQDEVWPKVSEKFGIKNPMALPRLEKIIINTGVGHHLENNKLKPEVRDTVIDSIATVSGQKPILIEAKKSVANFKVREGALSAAMVTLRRGRMWNFFDRLVNLAIPRVKDFRGLSDKSFDQAGNYSFGFSEQAVWPEIDMGRVNVVHGMHINLVFANSNPEMSKFVMTELGWPFRREETSERR